MSEIERLRAQLAEAKARIAELEAQTGWEVEGFIDRLTRRDDTNAERLVLEAISHLRGFNRDCNVLRTRAEHAEAEADSLRNTIDNMRAMNIKLTWEATGKTLAVEAERNAAREAVRKIRATDNITAVWHIADAALAPFPAGRDPARDLVSKQAEDEGLWFVPVSITEDYLQRALRALHEAVEGKSSEECARDALNLAARTP